MKTSGVKELKCCPFCGREANWMGETTSIKCKNCGGAFIVTNPLISRHEVAEAWNNRNIEQKEK